MKNRLFKNGNNLFIICVFEPFMSPFALLGQKRAFSTVKMGGMKKKLLGLPILESDICPKLPTPPLNV
jgi:hypothetical protein